MDVVAHGLWGGVPFYRLGRKKFFAGVLIGMAPDLLSFGVFHVIHPDWFTRRLAGEISGPPALSILPTYVFHSYNVTHSLFVWAVVFGLLWAVAKHPPWLLAHGCCIFCAIFRPTQRAISQRLSFGHFLPPSWTVLLGPHLGS